MLLLTVGPGMHVCAQTVRGTVLDAQTGVPIYTAGVAVIAKGDSIVAQYVTDKNGTFVFRVSAPGSYRLRATSLSYAAFTTNNFTLEPGQDAVVELRLQPNAIPLDSVATAVEARRLVRVGFYQRMMKGFGHFLTPENIREIRPVFPEDLFYGMSGIRVRSRGRVLGASYRPCALSVTVDGLLVEPGGEPRSESAPAWTDLFHVNDIEAIEVYPRPGGVPVPLSRDSPCGAILIWTKGSPR